MTDKGQLPIKALRGSECTDEDLKALGALRIEVFREWPYLYEGSLEYEAGYLATYRSSEDSLVLLAFDGEQIVGASTALPLKQADPEFQSVFHGSPYPVDSILYLGESVLLPKYRGRGIGHRFFDAREAHARTLGANYTAFCSVDRSSDDPRRPSDFRPLDAFWKGRGYIEHPEIQATFNWRELGKAVELPHTLTFWIKAL